MRRFEVEQALRELSRKTPEYFRAEIFAHGDVKVRTEALAILRDLDPKRRSTGILREMLHLI
jgi:hypothetical protein